jgi:hypothetical protein
MEYGRNTGDTKGKSLYMVKLLEMLREEGCESEILVILWTLSLISVEHQRC